DLVDPDRARQEAAADPGLGDDLGSDRSAQDAGFTREQRSLEARRHGIRGLVGLFAKREDGRPTVVVDLLGGDGLVSRVVESQFGMSDPVFLTCDASPDRVTRAWENGVPALRQPARRQILRDGSVDGVLLAHRSHHVPIADRLRVAQEAWRVLRPGGTFVLHDFAVGSPVDTWFAEVVHRYSATGHLLPHFTAAEMEGCLVAAGFGEVSVRAMDDSFRASGPTAAKAKLAMGRYLLDMYGLEELRARLGEPASHKRAYEIADRIFRYPDHGVSRPRATVLTDLVTGRPEAIMPRQALIGVGRKP
ncbi:methyltransferase domain-containing protein, partial [Streptomyces sp. ODS05-4]|uniref:methyltransferase domain-containing protein n=1 Tax=Streptomyces sp. ODS05-4 TaxID=2944939 RepID=UPI0021096C7B